MASEQPHPFVYCTYCLLPSVIEPRIIYTPRGCLYAIGMLALQYHTKINYCNKMAIYNTSHTNSKYIAVGNKSIIPTQKVFVAYSPSIIAYLQQCFTADMYKYYLFSRPTINFHRRYHLYLYFSQTRQMIDYNSGREWVDEWIYEWYRLSCFCVGLV